MPVPIARPNGTEGAQPETPGAPAKKRGKSKELKKIAEMVAYQKANFRGALQEYFQKSPHNAKITFETKPKDPQGSPHQRVFISKCTIDINGAVTEGIGHAPSKKPSVQFAALDVMFKLNLLTKEEYMASFETGGNQAGTQGNQ